jgi:antitoxin CptB
MIPRQNPEETPDLRRRRLRFRAWHRGMREVDLLLGPFADAEIGALDERALGEFEGLLLTPDQDLYAWIVGASDVPASQDTALLRRIIAFNRGAKGAGRS